MKLDPLDYRILDQLDRNARLSSDKIARALKVSADTVLYHMTKMQQAQVLERCTAVIDLASLGLLLFRVSLRLTKNISVASLEKKLFQQSYFFLIVETRGEHDLILWGAAPTLNQVQNAFSFCQEKLASVIRDSSLELITETVAYSRGYLINRPGKLFPARGNQPVKKLDVIERKILQELRQDARLPVTLIADRLKTTPAIVAYRIEKLERQGIISGYRVHLNSEIIGLQRFRVQLEFRSNFKRGSAALRKFCEVTPAITRLEFQIGAWSAEIGLEIQSFAALHEILDQLKALEGGNLQVVGVVLFRRTVSAPSQLWDKLLEIPTAS